MLTLLARDEGATLAELIAARGWLPHTTRAALSRIRTGGQPLAKATRSDTTIAYRILPLQPTARTRARRKGETSPHAATAGMGAEPQACVPMQVRA